MQKFDVLKKYAKYIRYSYTNEYLTNWIFEVQCDIDERMCS